MQLQMPVDLATSYSSASQRSRVITEGWGRDNLYCPNCDASTLSSSPSNTPAVDYICLDCKSPFQLKAQARAFSNRIADAAYSAMVRAIREDRTPNIFALHYDSLSWKVVNLFLIPHFAFPLSAVEKRPALGPNARRAGWVGCNILLGAIPVDARIQIVVAGKSVPERVVRKQYASIRPLEALRPEQRGWTLDVLNALRGLGKRDFFLSDVYRAENQLAQLYPANRHVHEKIRQQLQVLRDLGLLDFLGRGQYRVRQVQV
jgi:type II restriction enzyme